jgi:indole-3-glycerol phosphate synthase
MNLTLNDILAACAAESAKRQAQDSLPFVQRKVEKMSSTRGFAAALRKKSFSVIAEIKRKSPSMGTINPAAIEVAHDIYNSHPMVSAISVLTQEAQFGGSPEDLKAVRKYTQGRNSKPILRKDFIFSEYEVYYSRWIGADAILLMANVVTERDKFRHLHDLAISIGLDVLCEIHDESEISMLPPTVKLCGINSRKFKGVNHSKSAILSIKESVFLKSDDRDTKTDLGIFDLFDKLTDKIPSECLRIAESGMTAENIGSVLKKYPFNAALIGTSLLKSSRAQMPKILDDIQEKAALALEANTQAVVLS